jgi:hypothetical protein
MEYKTIWNGKGPCPLPFSNFKAIGFNFLSHQYGMAIAICANFQTPNFKGSACAGLQAFNLKCPVEALTRYNISTVFKIVLSKKVVCLVPNL